MVGKTRERRSNLSSAFNTLVTKTRGGEYQVRIPTEGDRVIKVSSEKNAKVIAEAEALRQKLAAR